MSRAREPLFPTDDLSDFATKPKAHAPAPPKDALAAVATEAGFQSREPRTPVTEPPPKPALAGHVTGRNAQINLKAKPSTIQAFAEIAEDRDWSKALTFERAVTALKRLLAEGVDPKSLDFTE